MKRRLPLFVVILTSTLCFGQDPDFFLDPAAGVSLRKPSSWRFASRPDGRATVEMADPRVDEQWKRTPTTGSVVLIAKYDLSHPGLGPSIGVESQELPAGLELTSSLEMVRLVLRVLPQSFVDYQLEGPPKELRVSSYLGAEFTASYKIKTRRGSLVPARTRTVYVKRLKDFLVLGVTAPPEEFADAQEQFDRVLASLRLE